VRVVQGVVPVGISNGQEQGSQKIKSAGWIRRRRVVESQLMKQSWFIAFFLQKRPQALNAHGARAVTSGGQMKWKGERMTKSGDTKRPKREGRIVDGYKGSIYRITQCEAL